MLRAVEPNWDSGDLKSPSASWKAIVALTSYCFSTLTLLLLYSVLRMRLDLRPARFSFFTSRTTYSQWWPDLTRFTARPIYKSLPTRTAGGLLFPAPILSERGIDALLQAWYLLQQQLHQQHLLLDFDCSSRGDEVHQPQLKQMAQALRMARLVNL